MSPEKNAASAAAGTESTSAGGTDGARRRPPKPPRPVPVPRTVGPRMTEIVARLADGTAAEIAEALALLDAVMAGPVPLREPVGDNEEIVTFLFRDPSADQVLLFANRLTDEARLEDTLMERLPGTAVWHAGFRMGSGWRASYCFVPARNGEQPAWLSAENHRQLRAALDSGLADPLNPRTAPNRDGRMMSVVELGRALVQKYSGTYDAARDADWRAAPQGHRVARHACGSPGPRSPVVVVFDGEIWLAQGLTEAAEAAVEAGELEPLHLLLLDSGGRERRWADLGGDRPVDAYVAEEMLPWFAREHGLETSPERTCAMGQSLGGLSALTCVLARPESVGRAISHSASLWQGGPQRLVARRLAEGTADQLAGTRIRLSVGDQEWVLVPPHRELLAELERTPARVDFRPYDGGHDYACWRGDLVPALIELFPAL